jgi:hypothetical protein
MSSLTEHHDRYLLTCSSGAILPYLVFGSKLNTDYSLRIGTLG